MEKNNTDGWPAIREPAGGLAEIRNKMSLLGHNDYDDYCRQLMAVLEKA